MTVFMFRVHIVYMCVYYPPVSPRLYILCMNISDDICVFFCPDLSIETVSGAAVVPVPVSPPAAAVSVQPGEGAAEPTAER